MEFKKWLDLLEYDQQTDSLFYKAIQKAKDTGRINPMKDILEPDWFPKVGLNIDQLLKAGVIEPSGVTPGSYQFNKDLAAVRNKEGIKNNFNPTAPPKPPEQKPIGFTPSGVPIYKNYRNTWKGSGPVRPGATLPPPPTKQI